MSVIAFVPARCGSKSIPLKNIKAFNGRPLIFWVLKALENSKQVNQIVVATDCNEIETCVQGFQFSKVSVYRRRDENATDQASTESVMLEYIESQTFANDDLFILCQATSPFTQAKDIDSALSQLRTEKADSLLTCCRLKRFIWNELGAAQNYDFKNRPRRQDFKGSLVENGAFYISSVGSIQTSKNRLSGKISIYEMSPDTFIELDEPQDWQIGESIFKRFHKISIPAIKLFLSDIDGVLTDAGMYYTENGDELKKFNTHDGMGFQLLKKAGIKTGLITSEDRALNKRRAEKLKLDYIYQDAKDKLTLAKELCVKEGISLSDVAYIGDDINDFELLSNVGLAACPNNAVQKIKSIPGIIHLSTSGGQGAVREFAEMILR